MQTNYFRLLWMLVKTSLISELEFRANMVLKVFNDFVWYFVQISVFKVLYLHTNQISGWDYAKIKVFLGFVFLSDTIHMMFYHENLEMMSERVRKGELDLVLAKPVNSQFMLSFFRLQTTYFFNFVFCLTWLLVNLNEAVGYLNGLMVVYILIMVICSNLIMYSIRFMISSLSVMLGRTENLSQIWFSIFRMSLRPDFVYPQWLRYTLLFALPLGFVASVPAHVLLGLRSEWWVLGAVSLAVVFVSMSTLVWRTVLRRYSSASS